MKKTFSYTYNKPSITTTTAVTIPTTNTSELTNNEEFQQSSKVLRRICFIYVHSEDLSFKNEFINYIKKIPQISFIEINCFSSWDIPLFIQRLKRFYDGFICIGQVESQQQKSIVESNLQTLHITPFKSEFTQSTIHNSVPEKIIPIIHYLYESQQLINLTDAERISCIKLLIKRLDNCLI